MHLMVGRGPLSRALQIAFDRNILSVEEGEV